jgi:hypothetical protein
MSERATGPVELVLLGKPGCHLCEEMKAVIEPELIGSGLALVERDVRDDPDWERRYLWEIPVLLLGGREVARHRLTADELRRRLAAGGFSPPGTARPPG